ncbi:NADPH:quinone reductase [Pseudonocardia thermophila]|jgi:NADPH:quinone reductase and related Zn-dependent oxidoreductases|uniref:NADPH:quinone reductase n=1 Tax=Pseudonocardia thermophila TaxID=1848 RepID=A0A1M6N582_PSETH|nr:NADPH:quinone reductase [Pseudonocardia thermophila]SHJ90915.1 NADPH:quinone reductase [Pseudonocardia thermophila]
MRAAWYERTGPAAEVLVVGDRPEPVPAPGEVRVRLAVAGINPRDVKRRAGAGDRVMEDPLVIPGDDGAGTIDATGAGVAPARIGERVWVHGAAFGRPFGTAAEYVTVPAEQAVPLPDGVPFEIGACLGVPALTAHRCVFADGPVDGRTVLVTGGAGAVGRYAVQFAALAGATVIATASTPEKRRSAREAGAHHVVDHRDPMAAQTIASLAGPGGVARIVDVAFGANLPLTSALIAPGGTIATYGSDAEPQPRLPFYPLMRKGVVIRTVLVFTMPPQAREAAVRDVTRWLASGALTHPVAQVYPLDRIAEAHEAVERGGRVGRVLLDVRRTGPEHA